MTAVAIVSINATRADGEVGMRGMSRVPCQVRGLIGMESYRQLRVLQASLVEK